MPDLLVQFGNGHRLDSRQAFGQHDDIRAEITPEREHRGKIQPDDNAIGDSDLAGDPGDDIPDTHSLKRLGPIHPVRARFTRGLAGLAVAFAPAEVPLGKGDKAFFSASSRSAGPR